MELHITEKIKRVKYYREKMVTVVAEKIFLKDKSPNSVNSISYWRYSLIIFFLAVHITSCLSDDHSCTVKVRSTLPTAIFVSFNKNSKDIIKDGQGEDRGLVLSANSG